MTKICWFRWHVAGGLLADRRLACGRSNAVNSYIAGGMHTAVFDVMSR